MTGLVIHLALHPLGVQVPCCPEVLCELHQLGSLVLKPDGLIDIDIHVPVNDVLRNLVTSGFQLSVINHILFLCSDRPVVLIPKVL